MKPTLDFDALRPAAAALLPPSLKVDTALFAGSLVERIGNARSDIDILVVIEDEPDWSRVDFPADGTLIDEGECRIFVSELGGRRADVEFRVRAEIESIFEELAGRDPEDNITRFALSTDWLQFFHGLAIGIPVLAPDELERLREQMPRTAILRHLVRRFVNEARGTAEDAVGAIEAGAPGAAMLMSRQALGSAVDAVLASEGHTSTKAKWRFEKAAAVGRQDLVKRYLELELEPAPDAEALLGSARARVLAVQDLIIEAEMNCADL